ncbi:MAG: SAM-dependent methyltransferase [Candidatus Saccharibacteria bacterium]|nr:SAM-dependent methyltransferase [Candidatus Saccharibacteria bacterium]
MPTVNAENNFVSRAEGKLEGAVRAFRYDFRNKTVLDIGSSTGGFTELALKLGAKKVIAIEKGTKQMKAPLRFDARVDLHEKTDFFDVLASDFGVDEVETVVADVSFVSLTEILAYAQKIVNAKADFLVMLKPQFEAEPDQLVKGVVKNEKMRREILKKFENWLKNNGFLVLKKRDNDVAGKKGNLERFYLLKIAKKA